MYSTPESNHRPWLKEHNQDKRMLEDSVVVEKVLFMDNELIGNLVREDIQ